jgi:hypothetical protein
LLPLNPPFESQEYGPIKHKIVNWSPVERIDDPAACGPLPPPDTFIDYFALGDSIASGHGLMDEGFCRRSALAYPHKVVDYLATRDTMRRQETLACSGATAARDPQSHNHLMRFHNQVQAVLAYLDKNGSNRPTLVSITIGANDLEFDDPGKALAHLEESDDDYKAWLEEVINHPQIGVKQSVKDAVVRLLAKPNVMVIITDYHNPFNKESILFNAEVWSKLNRQSPCDPEEKCYERIRLAVERLNEAFRAIGGRWERRSQGYRSPR